MAIVRMIHLMAMALALNAGFSPPAAAQQTDPAPLQDSSTMQEPPPLQSAQQPPSSGESVQLDNRSGNSEPTLEEDNGPGGSPSGGSIHIQESQGVRYASGGIGEGERDELNALSSQFNLRLLFAVQGSGNYLADVQVNIMDESGKTVLNAESQGPWFFAQLSPGAYRVVVSVLNQTQEQTVRVSSARQSHLDFYWR